MRIALILAIALSMADARSIFVRWLANPGTDSVAEYSIQRNGLEVGRAVHRAVDTLEFHDSTVLPATAYRYPMVAHTVYGLSSDTSSSSLIAFPGTLGMPDTLRAPQNGSLEYGLPSGYHPLRGSVQMALYSRTWVSWDSVGNKLVMAGVRAGRNELIPVSFCYYDKFCAADTVRIIIPAAKPGTPRNIHPRYYREK